MKINVWYSIDQFTIIASMDQWRSRPKICTEEDILNTKRKLICVEKKETKK